MVWHENPGSRWIEVPAVCEDELPAGMTDREYEALLGPLGRGDNVRLRDRAQRVRGAALMGETSIEWTDETWNPVTGCTKVSAGCKNCYAETLAERFWAKQYPKVPDEGFGIPGAVNQLRSREFTDVLFHEDRLALPLRWKKPRRVFVNSMSDLFHERLPFSTIARVFGVMNLADRHTFQILTKRAERMRDFSLECQRRDSVHGAWPLPNVWLGVSVEDQAAADDRIRFLLQTPAAVRFLSLEPLLGPLDLAEGGHGPLFVTDLPDGRRTGISWVIVGSESGSRARPCDLAWVRSLRDQCSAAGVAFFWKQYIERGRKVSLPTLDGRQWVEMP